MIADPAGARGRNSTRASPSSIPDRPILLVTGHRRENFGAAVPRTSARRSRDLVRAHQIQVVYPVHLNPNVQEPVKAVLGGVDHVHLIEPLDYLPFVYLMQKSHVILTDSGGIQEEAPSLGKPVFVMRERDRAARGGGGRDGAPGRHRPEAHLRRGLRSAHRPGRL